MSEEAQLNSALNLMRRMPPASVENSLAGLIELVPDLTDELLQHVDQPLKVEKDTKAGKSFILCEYNRDGDSYRSPWTNEYYPAMDDGFTPSDRLRKMEAEANKVFDVYRKLYFDTGYSSCYYFETDEKSDSENFGACFLIHKDVEPLKSLEKGSWDSIHVFEVNKIDGDTFEYKLTTTVMVAMVLKDGTIGSADLSGNMTNQTTQKAKVTPDSTHLQNLGKMLEEMELRIRNGIEGTYIQKTREVINGMRSATGQRDQAWLDITKSLSAAVISR
jgi:capping protein beta